MVGWRGGLGAGRATAYGLATQHGTGAQHGEPKLDMFLTKTNNLGRAPCTYVVSSLHIPVPTARPLASSHGHAGHNLATSRR